MKVISHVVALLVLLGAAYFTLEHKRKFEELEEVRFKTIQENKSVSDNADAKEVELKQVKEALATTEQKREELAQAHEVLKADSRKLATEEAKWNAELKVQQDEFAELEKARDEVATILKGLGEDVTMDNLGEKIESLDEERKQQQAKLEELETLSESATKALSASRAEMERLAKRESDRNTRIQSNAMEAVVTAVDQDWGFLVIGAGSNSGFTPQTSLIVKRDGRMIGRVMPSSIEPTQTIAEIDFKSMASGVRIQPGDRVILSKPAAN